jgi:hypothetical protein
MWTRWCELSDGHLSEHWSASPGVYRIRLLDSNGRPVEIRRILGVDTDGIIYIGMAARGRDGGLSNRLWGFWMSAFGRDASAHAAGARYKRLLSKHLPRHQVEYSYRKVSGAREAKQLEAECLRKYAVQWGELPPLNHAGAS